MLALPKPYDLVRRQPINIDPCYYVWNMKMIRVCFFLSCSYLLRHIDKYQRVFIAPDITSFERQKYHKLVEELRERRAQGETGLIIWNGSVIVKPPRFDKPPPSSRTSQPVQSSWWIAWFKELNQLSIFYTNIDQFLNKKDDLETAIAGNKPDIILITEILPKACCNTIILD